MKNIAQEACEKDVVITSLHTQIKERDSKIDQLELRVKWLTQAIFGAKSEKQNCDSNTDGQQFFDFLKEFNGEADSAPEEATDKPEEATRKKPRKKSSNQLVFPDDLEYIDVLIDLPEDEKVDPITGKALSLITTNEILKLIMNPATFQILRFIQPVYGNGSAGVEKMSLPETILPNCRADVSVIVDSLVKRFCDHLPFYRQCDIYARNHFHVSRQTLDKWFLDIGKALTPLFVLLQDEILKSLAIHVDESHVKLQVKGKGKLKTAYMWLLCGSPPGVEGQLVWMHFADNRKHENAKILIRDYHGVVHSDCYEAYETLASQEDSFTWAPCWVHARRKFINATEGATRDKAIEIMTLMMKYEKSSREAGLIGEDLLEVRRRLLKPLFDELVKLLETQQHSVLTMTSKSLSGATSYFLKRKDDFEQFISNEHALMDNNHAENAVRPLAIGRKNWLFTGSNEAGASAAGMYSLLLSCKNLGINPHEYLEDVLRNFPYTSKENLHKLLPHNWSPSKNPLSPYLPANYSCQ